MLLGFQAYRLVQSNTLMLELDQVSLTKRSGFNSLERETVTFSCNNLFVIHLILLLTED